MELAALVPAQPVILPTLYTAKAVRMLFDEIVSPADAVMVAIGLSSPEGGFDEGASIDFFADFHVRGLDLPAPGETVRVLIGVPKAQTFSIYPSVSNPEFFAVHQDMSQSNFKSFFEV